ncbi:MAG: hypothetical protein IIA61_13400 [Candidatus Marinimicrobia bacterium]|nr:hypothetical protein [Candidatus Neomarinimicrobiota bacterium]
MTKELKKSVTHQTIPILPRKDIEEEKPNRIKEMRDESNFWVIDDG